MKTKEKIKQPHCTTLCTCQHVTLCFDTQQEDVILGVPGPFNWRGAIFKNIIRNALTLAKFPKWYQSAVEDPLPTVPGPEPVVGFYSYLGTHQFVCLVNSSDDNNIGLFVATTHD